MDRRWLVGLVLVALPFELDACGSDDSASNKCGGECPRVGGSAGASDAGGAGKAGYSGSGGTSGDSGGSGASGSSGASGNSGTSGSSGSAGANGGSAGVSGGAGEAGAAGNGCPSGLTGPSCDLPRFETFAANTVSAVSSDGSTVIGGTTTVVGANATSTALRFRHADGVVPLAPLDPYTMSTASALSADGGAIVGYSSSTTTRVATRWDASGTPTMVPAVAGDDNSQATQVSQDGTIVLGWSTLGTSGVAHAFVWSQAKGVVQLGAQVSGGLQPVALSADGAVAVLESPTGGGTAYLWSNRGASPTLNPLPALAGDTSTVVQALSGNGDVAVGYSVASDMTHHQLRWVSGGTPTQIDSGWTCAGPISSCVSTGLTGSEIYGERNGFAVSWNSAQGVVELGRPMSAFGCAVFLSPVGSTSDLGVCFGPPYPVVWTDPTTPVTLASVLSGLGANTQMFLTAPSLAYGVSASGKVMVGLDLTGTTTGWIARLD